MAYFETPSITVSHAVMLFVAFLIVTLIAIMLVPSHSQTTNVLIGLKICWLFSSYVGGPMKLTHFT